MKFKEGDIVKILDGEGINHYANDWGWTDLMSKYIGRVAVITQPYSDGYRLKPITISRDSISDRKFPFGNVWDERGLEFIYRSETTPQINFYDLETGQKMTVETNTSDEKIKFDVVKVELPTGEFGMLDLETYSVYSDVDDYTVLSLGDILI